MDILCVLALVFLLVWIILDFVPGAALARRICFAVWAVLVTLIACDVQLS